MELLVPAVCRESHREQEVMSEHGDSLGVGMCHGLTSSVISSLKQNGVYTVCDLIAQELEQLALKTGIPFKELAAIRRELSAQFAAKPASVKFNEFVKSVELFLTGFYEINKYLEGGLYSHEIMEVVGDTGTGKTQFCMCVAIEQAISSEMNILWIDTTGSFDMGKYKQMLAMRVLDNEDMNSAQSLYTMTALTPVELLASLEKTKRLLNSRFSSVRLIIIDTVSVLLSSLSGNSSEGHRLLVQISRCIKEMVLDSPVIVLMTNSITSSSALSPDMAALGRVWASVPNIRLLLQRELDEGIHERGTDSLPDDEHYIKRWATLIKSCRQACQGSVPFIITDDGFESP